MLRDVLKDVVKEFADALRESTAELVKSKRLPIKEGAIVDHLKELGVEGVVLQKCFLSCG